MRLHIIVVRDSAADCFGQPQFVPNVGASIRGFGDQVNSPDAGALYSHPEHFELFTLGTYDDSDASMELHAPKSLAIATNFKK